MWRLWEFPMQLAWQVSWVSLTLTKYFQLAITCEEQMVVPECFSSVDCKSKGKHMLSMLTILMK